MTPKTISKQAAKATPDKRTYNSSRRKVQAAQTRAEVLTAAMRLFNESGWAGTTVAAIADEAGVAVETVYSGFGSKKALVRDAFDASIVGDANPVPYVERPEFASLGDGSLAQRVRAAMDLLFDIHERSAGIWDALHEAAAGDDALATWATESEQRRRIDVGRSLELVFERPILGLTLDALWVLVGPATYRTLVVECARSQAEYQRTIAEAIVRILGADLTALDALDPVA